MTLVRPTQRWHSRLIQVPHVGPVYRPRSNGRTALEFEVPEAAVPYLVYHSFVQVVEVEAESDTVPNSGAPAAHVATTIKQPNPTSVEPDQDQPPELEPEGETEPSSVLTEAVPPVELEPEVTPPVADLPPQETPAFAAPLPLEEEPPAEEEVSALPELSLDDICAFLTGKNRTQLMEIKGIGPKAAGEVVRAAPLTPEKLTNVLKENQIQAVIEAMRG